MRLLQNTIFVIGDSELMLHDDVPNANDYAFNLRSSNVCTTDSSVVSGWIVTERLERQINAIFEHAS